MNISTHLYKITWLTCAWCMGTGFLQAQYVLKVQSGASLSATGGATITLTSMDLDNDGIISFQPGEGGFHFNGSDISSISGSVTPLFDVLSIAKTGGAYLFLEQNIQVGTEIDFYSGLIDLNGANILLMPNALLYTESETSRITGTNGGYVEITVPLNAPALANPGNLGAVISSSNNMGNVTIRRGHQSQANGFGAGNSIFRYYDITPTNNSALNATVHLSYFDAELNSLDESTLGLWTTPDAQHWSSKGFTSRDAAGNYVELAVMNSFSRVTLSSAANALPLVWGAFGTQCLSGQVRINWQTIQEQNTASFTIRRSTDGSNWTSIASIPAAGSSNSTLSYTYTDLPSAGAGYYQLIEQDADGRQTVSPVLTSQCGIMTVLKAYPNPVVNNCQVSVLSADRATITLQLLDAKGALLKQQARTLVAGNNQINLSMQEYTPGVYSLVVTWNDGKTKTLRLEKQ